MCHNDSLQWFFYMEHDGKCEIMLNYGDQSYWDNRYKNQIESFEWYVSYQELKSHLEKALQINDHAMKKVPTLLVGCGNSLLSEGLFHDGFTSILSVDYSEVVIKKMQRKYADVPALQCMQGFYCFS